MPHHFLYVADPMCSWCYGFAPVIERIAEHFHGRVPVRVKVGGLRAGNTRAMRQEDKDYIRAAWSKVETATGRPFDRHFFDRVGFIYDTEPACRAVVAAREIAPEKALVFKGHISDAFYGHNRDTTDPEILTEIADETGIDATAFRAAFLAPTVRNHTFQDFLSAKQMGIEGFPCLLLGGGDGHYAMVTNGYRPLDGMIDGIERWLTTKASAHAGS